MSAADPAEDLIDSCQTALMCVVGYVTAVRKGVPCLLVAASTLQALLHCHFIVETMSLMLHIAASKGTRANRSTLTRQHWLQWTLPGETASQSGGSAANATTGQICDCHN